MKARLKQHQPVDYFTATIALTSNLKRTRMDKTCENCVYCERDVTLRLCAIKELYTFVNPDDEACEDYVSKFEDQ